MLIRKVEKQISDHESTRRVLSHSPKLYIVGQLSCLGDVLISANYAMARSIPCDTYSHMATIRGSQLAIKLVSKHPVLNIPHA